MQFRPDSDCNDVTGTGCYPAVFGTGTVPKQVMQNGRWQVRIAKFSTRRVLTAQKGYVNNLLYIY